jgi:hypothetical protein
LQNCAVLACMLSWNNKLKAIAALAAFGIYFALAGWAKVAYVDPTPAGEAVVQPMRLPRVPSGKIVVQLKRPFEPFGKLGVVCYQLRSHEDFEAIADTDEDRERSPVLLYENDQLLGPPHSGMEDIAARGQGRYLHGRRGLIFSASDNSFINTNGRTYWAVLPN